MLKLGNIFDVKTFSDKVNLEFERIFSFLSDPNWVRNELKKVVVYSYRIRNAHVLHDINLFDPFALH